MSAALADDPSKDIIVHINDWSPQFVTAQEKLSKKLGRPLRGIMLIDAERKASGNYVPDKQSSFEEIVVDFLDDGALRKAMKSIEERLLIVYCDSEASQLYFKRVIPHVPYVNTPTESSLVFSTDKGKMRELLRSYDETISPKAMVVRDSSPESIQEICDELGFPLIIKPTNLIASMLVNKASDVAELREVLKRNFTILNEIYSEHRGLGDRTMVVEEFVKGELYSTDIYVDATGKVYVLPFVHFQNGAMVGMEGYHEYERETYLTLSDQEQQEGIKTAEKAVHALGLRSSVAHIELFHTVHGWKIVELGARAGGQRQEMYEISYGIDHAYNGLLNKIGLAPEMPSEPIRTYCKVFNIHAPKTGILESIHGVEEARMHQNMYSIYTNLKPGEEALPSTLGGLEIVNGLMFGTDHEQLDRDIAAVRASISVHIASE